MVGEPIIHTGLLPRFIVPGEGSRQCCRILEQRIDPNISLAVRVVVSRFAP